MTCTRGKGVDLLTPSGVGYLSSTGTNVRLSSENDSDLILDDGDGQTVNGPNEVSLVLVNPKKTAFFVLLDRSTLSTRREFIRKG